MVCWYELLRALRDFPVGDRDRNPSILRALARVEARSDFQEAFKTHPLVVYASGCVAEYRADAADADDLGNSPERNAKKRRLRAKNFG